MDSLCRLLRGTVASGLDLGSSLDRQWRTASLALGLLLGKLLALDSGELVCVCRWLRQLNGVVFPFA